MAGDYALAEAFVRIRPDATGFRAETEKAIKTALAGIKPEVKVKVTPDVAGLTAATVAAVKAAAAAAGNIKIPVQMEISADPAEITRQVQLIRQRMVSGGLTDFLDYNLPIGRIQYQIGLIRRLLQQGKLTDFLATSLQPGQVLQQGQALRDALQHELGSVGIGTSLNAADLSAEAVAARAALVEALGKISVPVTEVVSRGVTPEVPIPPISTGGNPQVAQDAQSAADALLREAAAARNAGDAAKYAYAANIALRSGMQPVTDAATTMAGRWGALTNKVTLFGGALAGVPLLGTIGLWHILADAIIEIAAVIIPATIAFGLFGAAAIPTAQTIYQKMQAVWTTSQALGQSIYPLTGNFQKLSDAAKPGTLQLFGEALVVLNQNSGRLIPVITAVGKVLDTLGARAAVALTSGGIGTFLRNGPQDLAKIGDIIGNIFGTIGNLLRTVPGYAQVLLNALDAVTKGIEHITSSPIADWLFKLGFAAHGAILYLGLLATGITLAGNALVGLAAKFGLASDSAVFFNAKLLGVGVRQMIGGLGLLGGELVTLGASEDIAAAGALTMEGAFAALSALAPVLIITGIVFAIYELVKAFGSATSATQSYDDAVNKALQNTPVTNLGTQLINSQADATRHLRDAQTQLSDTQKYVMINVRGTGVEVQRLSLAYQNQLGIISGYKGELVTLQGYQANYNTLLRAAHGNVGLLNDAGITSNQILTASAEQLKQYIIEVQAAADAQNALSLGTGRAAAAQNAQTNQWMTSGLPAMQKVITAEDAITNMILSGEQAFTGYDQALEQLGTNLGVNADKLLGFNKAGLTTANDIFSTVLPAFQKTIDAAQGMNVSTGDLTKIIATEAKQFLLLAGNNNTAKAALVGMINNALGPGTVSFKSLNTWIKNNATSQQGLNQLWSNATVQAGTLAGVIQQQLTAQFIALSLKQSGAVQATVDFKNALLNSGNASDATRSARQRLINDLINAGDSASQAKAYVDNLQRQIDALHGKTVGVGVAGVGEYSATQVAKASLADVIAHIAHGFAGGTSGAAPGWAWVGEQGPELINMGGGEVVIPNHMLGYAQGTPGAIPGLLFGATDSPLEALIRGNDQGLVNTNLTALVNAKQRLLQAIGIGVGVGAGVGQWAGDVNMVLQMLEGPGQQPGDLSIVLSQMTTESGGNPYAVNKWDSNWIAGHPSVGLMQVIAGTYASYGAARWGYPQPVSYGVSEAPVPNIYAGMNYAIATYGPGWRNVLGHGHGYAHGAGLPPSARPARILGGAPNKITLEIKSSGSNDFDRFMTTWMQKSVIVRGGGNVQSAWGAG